MTTESPSTSETLLPYQNKSGHILNTVIFIENSLQKLTAHFQRTTMQPEFACFIPRWRNNSSLLEER